MVPWFTHRRGKKSKFFREFCLRSADLSGQDVCVALGALRFPTDAAVRYIRFVPLSDEEIADWHKVRELAKSKGRPFAAYVECSPAIYESVRTSLHDYLRNDMRLNKLRGATEVYAHVIRIGSKAWYYSDLIERFMPTQFPEGSEAWRGWNRWMKQGDFMAVALEQGHRAGLKVFADLGMSAAYLRGGPHYEILSERFSREHPQYTCGPNNLFLNYRQSDVRDYAVAIAQELMTKYDVDGINLDFARWGYNKGYDESSLVDVLRRVHEARREAERKWGHSIVVSTRIPSYFYDDGRPYVGEHPWFTAALSVWAKNGWIDRVMTCCALDKKRPQLSIERYIVAIAGTEAEFWGDLYWPVGLRTSEGNIQLARKWIEEGLNGGFFYYQWNRPIDFEHINWRLRLVDFPDVRVEP